MLSRDVPMVVELHRKFLNYSLNSKLGASHLAYVYREMMQDPDSLIMIAEVEGVLAGVVSATVAPGKLKTTLTAGMRLPQWLRIASKFVAHPGLFHDWHAFRQVEKSVKWQGKAVEPILTAIAVDPNFRNRGFGKQLVAYVDAFVRTKGHDAYRLDTRADNDISRLFYKQLGFVEVEQRGRDVVLVKDLKGNLATRT